MGDISQLWLLRDSKSWSKRDAKYLVTNFLASTGISKDMKRVVHDTSIYHANILGLDSDSKKLIPTKLLYGSAHYRYIYKLGWTFFQTNSESFYCRESLTYNLQRNLVSNGENLDTNKMSLVRHSLPAGDSFSFLEEHWPKFVNAFLGMCGVSKNISKNFTGYNNKYGYGVFPASLALWRSTLLTAPSVLVALMRHKDLFIKPTLNSLNTIPEIIELLLEDRKESWDTGGKRLPRFNNFGLNAILWFALLWTDKLRAVCDDFEFINGEHYADGPNNFISCTAPSIAKILSGFDAEEQKEMYLLLGRNDKALYQRVIANYRYEVRDILYSFGGI